MPQQTTIDAFPGDRYVIDSSGGSITHDYNIDQTSIDVFVEGAYVPPEPPPDPGPDYPDPPPPNPPPPAGGDQWATSFLSYPAASGYNQTSTAFQLYRNATDVEIGAKTFQNLGSQVESIRFENCRNVWVHDCDFKNVAQVVTAWNTENLRLEWCRYENITGPAQPRIGRNIANFVQLAVVNGANVVNNKGKGGDTEDIVSIYKSHNCYIARNHFQGTNWTSGSGSGIALGDAGGSGNIAQSNILLNPGQVGIFIAGGTSCQMLDNIIIKPQGSLGGSGDVGMYVWNQYTSTCANHTVNGNRVLWYKANGSLNPFWNSGNCGPVTGANYLNDMTLNPASYVVTL